MTEFDSPPVRQRPGQPAANRGASDTDILHFGFTIAALQKGEAESHVHTIRARLHAHTCTSASKIF